MKILCRSVQSYGNLAFGYEWLLGTVFLQLDSSAMYFGGVGEIFWAESILDLQEIHNCFLCFSM